MKMNILSGGRLRMKKSVYIPTAERHETIELPISCYLLRHPQGNVLFDTGCHPSVVDNAEARWGSMAKAMVPIGSHDDNLISQLTTVGLDPEDIDLVVNSHFHSDHCGCNEFFRKATVVCHASELENAEQPDGVARGFLPIDWKQPWPIETIEGERDLFGDGRIVLVPVPGHTPGMIAGMVALERDGKFLLASDAVALEVNLTAEVLPKNTWNADQATNSLSEIKRIQASGFKVLFGHDDAQWKSLRTGANFYE
jgi:N-acyl homoserine lactone hydrolase